MVNANSDSYRLKIHDELDDLKRFVAMDSMMQYDSKSYNTLKDNVFYKDLCSLLQSVASIH